MSAVRAFCAAATLAIVALPNVCLACPVCFDPRESNQWAFLSMTMFMSLLPLSMFGALVLFVRHRVKAAEASSDAAREPG